jgi:hypothetical protein
MRSDNLHIIQKQSIEINFDSMDDPAGLQNRVTEMFYEQFQPRMEVLLDEMFGKDQYTSVEKLEIDCGVLNMENWEQEFAAQAMLKLKEGLVQVNKKEIDVNGIEETTAVETFFFFLENGFLPWNKRIESVAELEKLLKVDEKLIVRIKRLIRQKEKAAERVAYQFSVEFIAKILTAFIGNRKQETELLSAIIEKINDLQSRKNNQERIDRKLVDAAILKVLASEDHENRELQLFTYLLSKVETNDDLKSEIIEIIQKLRVPLEIQRSAMEENLPESEIVKSQVIESGKPETKNQKHITENTQPSDTIYITNAGLILLHPFLPALFGNLKLVEENAWKDTASKQKAALAMEFLVTGKDETEEFDLVLNKILCGIENDEIVPTAIKLNEETKTECENLLKSVITHWDVLKNTSIDGLREAFMQRNGKLSVVDDGWLMQVEQKSIDVLLNHLPWGIGIIKLPWMNEMLYVEWG